MHQLSNGFRVVTEHMPGLASASVGIDGAVPGRVTEMPAAAHPNRAACSGAMPVANAAAIAP